MTDARFLVRAAAHYGATRPLSNQTAAFLFIWGALSQEEQEHALELWQQDQETASHQTVPQAAVDLIKEFEGYHTELPDGRAKAYADAIHGWDVPTIGFGTTRYPDGSKVLSSDVIDRKKAEELLIWEIEESCRPQMEKIPTWDRMNDNQQSAIYSFAYNLGPHFYSGANFQSITRVCDTPSRWSDYEWVKAQFVKYRNPGSSAEAGLRRRREAEAKLFVQ